MGIITIEYEFFNPRNPKCRACKYWGCKDRMDYSAHCINTVTKADKLCRPHNAKACSQFKYFGGFK